MAEPITPGSLKDTAALNLLVDSKVGTSRSAVKDELNGKIVYDDNNVFRRLRIDDVDNDFVAACVGSFEQDNKAEIKLLEDLAQQGSKKTNEDLEQEGYQLTIPELGSDPTVLVLDDSETQRLTGGQTYPSAIVSGIGNDPREWCTIGPPIWSSVSFLGRGTNVWRVRQCILDTRSGQLCSKGTK